MFRMKIRRTWFVVVFINHGDRASVLWSTKTDDKDKAKQVATELGNLIPEHGFEIKHSVDAMKVFVRDAIPALDEIKLVAMARLVC